MSTRPDLSPIFRAVRECATPAAWSKGVEIARKDAVAGDRESDQEIVLRVRDTGASSISAVVTLQLEDEAWDCSCGGDDPCQHVTAAVIALRRAAEQGQLLPRASGAGGRLAYRLRRDGGNLLLERWAVAPGGEEARLDVALTALIAGRAKGPRVAATSEDMEVELALGAPAPLVAAKSWPAVLKALARVEGVTLDGAPAVVRPDPVGVRLVVADEGPGVKAFGEQDPDIVELFANGVAVCRSGVRAVQLPQLAPREQEIVRKGRFFGRQEIGELAAEILPALEGRLPIDVRSDKLPGRARMRPRIELELHKDGDELTVVPRLVYGEPVVARVEAGRLHALGATVPVRDQDAERVLRDRLARELGLDLDTRVRRSAAEAVAFVERLGRFEGDVVGEGYAAFRRRGVLVPRFTARDDGFELEFEAADGAGTGTGIARGNTASGGSADPARVLAAWRAGEPLVQLLDGGFASLPKDWLSRFGDKIEALLAARAAARDGASGLPRAALPLVAEVCEDLGAEPPPALAALRAKLQSFDRVPPAELPADLTADLRPYQRQGVDWLACVRGLGFGALLADDMGLGKTLQTLAAIRGRTLVVAPTSVVFNWIAEARKFRPGLRVALYHGATRALDATADVVVTTYALLRLDLDALAAVRWDMLVLDEAQAVKNPDSQVARAARRIDAEFRLALTGTPVENRLDDLFSQMQILNPGLLGTRAHFQDAYARPIAGGRADAAATLRARVKPFLLRRLKADVAKDLPPRTDTVLHVELSSAERKHYDAVKAATRADVLERLQSGGGGVLEALEALLRLRQACCHPDLLPGVEGEASSKLALLVETLQEAVAEGHKALVFSQWTSFLDLMEPALATAGIRYLRLDGATADRQGVVQAFQAADGPPVLIMSLKAGGVGLNLTAADHVIIADPWWNPAAEDQAADRAHRIGQERPVLVQRLVALDSVEERILALQAAKRALAAAVVSDGDAGAAGGGSGLTREDLLALLG